MKRIRAHDVIRAAYRFDSRGTAPQLLCDLVDYAAQSPGFEFGNYGTMSAYRSDQRQSAKGWQDVKDAANHFAVMGGTTDDLKLAMVGGRTSWSVKAPQNEPSLADLERGPFTIHYTAGQYFCTEFRRNIAQTIERAALYAEQRWNEKNAA